MIYTKLFSLFLSKLNLYDLICEELRTAKRFSGFEIKRLTGRSEKKNESELNLDLL